MVLTKGFGKQKEQRPFSLQEISRKCLPSRREDELGIFSCIMNAQNPGELYQEVEDLLAPEAFTDLDVREVWSAMGRFREQRMRIDFRSLSNYLTDYRGKDEKFMARVLTDAYSCDHDPKSIRDYAEGLSNMHRKRNLGESSLKILEAVTDPTVDAEAALSLAEVEIRAQRTTLRSRQERSGGCVGDIVDNIFQTIDDIRSGKQMPDTIRTGTWYDFDKASQGWLPGDLIVLAAPSSGGKSTAGSILAKDFAKQGIPAIFVSFEEHVNDIARKMIANESKVSAGSLRSGEHLPQHKIEEARRAGQLLKQIPVAITQPKGRTFEDMRKAIAQEEVVMKERFDGFSHFRVVIVDYLQLLGSTSDVRYRTQAIDQATTQCKELAIEMGATVVCLAQWDTETVKSGRKPDNVTLLAGCKSISNHADQLIAMWSQGYANRPDLHNNNTIEFVWLKNRHGSNSVVQMGIDWSCSWIYPIAQNGATDALPSAPPPMSQNQIQPKTVDWEQLRKYQDEPPPILSEPVRPELPESSDGLDAYILEMPEVDIDRDVDFLSSTNVLPLVESEPEPEPPSPAVVTEEQGELIEGTEFHVGEVVNFINYPKYGKFKVKVLGVNEVVFDSIYLDCLQLETKPHPNAAVVNKQFLSVEGKRFSTHISNLEKL